MDKLNLTPGNWLVSDCGKMPSEKNCKLVMLAPEGQQTDLVEAAVAHAVKSHGHQDTPELRTETEKGLTHVTI
jgi:hypothetical protein